MQQLARRSSCPALEAEPTVVALRLGDWRDTLPGTYDPATAVVITDPPYGLDAGKGYEDVRPWAEHVREVLELLPARRHVIRGPATAIMRRDYPEPRRLCVEVATARARATFRPRTVAYIWQGWVVYGALRIGNRSDAVDAVRVHPYANRDDRGGARGHRAVTPLHAASWSVRTWSEPGDLVVDPYMGTGTIGRIARETGRGYLGSELDVRWYGEACRLLANEQRTLELA